MAVPHLIEPSNLTDMFAIIVTASLAGLKLRVCLRNSLNAERARTRRMTIALRGVNSRDRADIIRACAALEAATGTPSSLKRSLLGITQTRRSPPSFVSCAPTSRPQASTRCRAARHAPMPLS